MEPRSSVQGASCALPLLSWATSLRGPSGGGHSFSRRLAWGKVNIPKLTPPPPRPSTEGKHFVSTKKGSVPILIYLPQSLLWGFPQFHIVSMLRPTYRNS